MAPDPVPDLFDRMVAEGHALFSLAALDVGLAPTEGRERQLVEAAVQAGVLGALAVMRADQPTDER